MSLGIKLGISRTEGLTLTKCATLASDILYKEGMSEGFLVYLHYG